MTIRQNTLIYDKKDGISYCQIAKVASSSWCNHFIKLAKVSDKEYRRWSEAKQLFAPKLWPPPTKQEDLLEAWHAEDNLSIVIVRHPMSRLASVYYQKFIELKDHKAWKKVIRRVIARYRKSVGGEGPEGYPTPNEYLRFILDQLREIGADRVDAHWRPQYLSCPFCLLNFSVYAHMEELNEDSLYFFLKSGLLENVDFKQKLNSAHAKTDTEEKFWSEVDPEIIELIDQPWSYKSDLDMFGYTIKEYLDNILYIQL